MTKDNSILIVTGESSGELYGALLSRALRSLSKGIIHIYGVGGERMRAEGVELISGITGAFGLSEALSSLRALRNTLSEITRILEEKRPSVVVLIDFPDFNLKVAKRARSLGIKVLYYVSPQIWAWRSSRLKIIKELSDRIAVILPFEEKIYRDAGAQCEFVGHPMLEEIGNIKGTRDLLIKDLGLKDNRKVIGLLPGSRQSELRRLMPVFIDVVEGLKTLHPDHQFILAVASNLDYSDYDRWFRSLEELDVRMVKGMTTEALSISNLALVASGTATLQTALLGVPMVVVYKLFPITYLIGRIFINVKYISLVNLLMSREVVKELIQWKATPENIICEIERIISDEQLRSSMTESFRKIRALFSGKNASRRVAEMVIELL
jgi:lipid-A-disaccharide synthase